MTERNCAECAYGKLIGFDEDQSGVCERVVTAVNATYNADVDCGLAAMAILNSFPTTKKTAFPMLRTILGR